MDGRDRKTVFTICQRHYRRCSLLMLFHSHARLASKEKQRESRVAQEKPGFGFVKHACRITSIHRFTSLSSSCRSLLRVALAPIARRKHEGLLRRIEWDS